MEFINPSPRGMSGYVVLVSSLIPWHNLTFSTPLIPLRAAPTLFAEKHDEWELIPSANV